jgi:hypothetical protein
MLFTSTSVTLVLERGILRFAWFPPHPCSHFLIVVMIRGRILLHVTLSLSLSSYSTLVALERVATRERESIVS